MASPPVNWRIPDWFKGIDAGQRERLKKFFAALCEENKTINLVSAKSLVVADAVHFADSILASNAIMGSGQIDEIYDLGSGNGFPGMVLAILFPKTKVKLVEFDSRKAECLRRIADSLRFSNVEVICRKVEDLPDRSIRFGVTRGFGPISKTIFAARKPFAKGAMYFHIKGDEWAREVAEIPTQLCSFWLPSLMADYKLPIGSAQFFIVATKKIAD
jgi:16S rRNA (guanine527-N7)-methyltransferase